METLLVYPRQRWGTPSPRARTAATRRTQRLIAAFILKQSCWSVHNPGERADSYWSKKQVLFICSTGNHTDTALARLQVAIHETVRYWNVIYMNYSRYTYETEMSYTWTTAGKYMKQSGIEMSYTWTTAENTWNSQVLKCHIHELQQGCHIHNP